MSVIRRADDDGIDIFLIDELPEIIVSLRLWIFLGGGSKMIVVHIAERDDVLTADFLEVVAAPASHANHAQVQLVTGGESSAGGEVRSDEPDPRGPEGGLLKEFPTIQ